MLKGIAYLNEMLKCCVDIRPREANEKAYVLIRSDGRRNCKADFGYTGGKRVVVLQKGNGCHSSTSNTARRLVTAMGVSGVSGSFAYGMTQSDVNKIQRKYGCTETTIRHP